MLLLFNGKIENAVGESLSLTGITAQNTYCVGAGLSPPNVDLPVNGEVFFDEDDFIVGLHFVEQPIWVALEDLREMHADVTCGFAETVHDSA